MTVGRAKISRTLDALRNNKILLNKSIQHISISYQSQKAGNSGTRNFLYEMIPPIRYHNPSVTVSVVKNKEDTGVAFIRDNGTTEKINTTDLDAEQILAALVSKTESTDSRAADPLRPDWVKELAIAERRQ